MEDRKELDLIKGIESNAEQKVEKGNSIILFISVCFTIFNIWEVLSLSLPPLIERVIFVTFGMVLCFLTYPLSSRINRRINLLISLLLVALSVAACVYLVMVHDNLLDRLGSPTLGDMLFGVLVVILILEATRRSIGSALCLMALGALAYAFWGQYLPKILGQHGGYEIARIVTQTSLSTEGIFGSATYVMFLYVYLFVLFGNVLAQAGGTEFIIDMARSLFGGLTGGPAKMSVFSSSLFGTISGSAVANVMVDGWVNIPMMIRTGFKPYVAAAVEAVTSTGGALMPPVMGAAAFVMAEYLGVSYVKVATAAALPAILYYMALFWAVHFYAKQNKLFGVPRKELPKIWDVLKRRGYTFLIPLGTIIYFLGAQYSTQRAVIYAILVTFIVSLFSKTTRLGPRKILDICKKSAQDSIALVCACGTVGIVVAVVLMSGLGLRLPDIIIQIAGGSLFLTLFLVMISSLILGMGLPTTVCYILLATLIAPTLIKMGVVPMAAHLFIFYFGMLSMVTPPVAMAAYAAATLAKAPFMKTGWMAWRLALVAFLLPFTFVYSPELLLIGSGFNIVLAFVSASLGVYFLSAAIIGYLEREASWIERLLFLAASGLLIKPGWITDLIGLGLGAIALIFHLYLRKERDQEI